MRSFSELARMEIAKRRLCTDTVREEMLSDTHLILAFRFGRLIRLFIFAVIQGCFQDHEGIFPIFRSGQLANSKCV